METLTFTKPTEVVVGRPAIIPEDLLVVFRHFFDMRGDIRAARLAWIMIPGDPAPPHYLLGIETDAVWSDIRRGLHVLLEQHAPDILIDIKQVNADHPTTLFDEIEAFYPFSRFERLKFILGFS